MRSLVPYTILLVFFSLSNRQANAQSNTVAGGEITYEFVTDSVYDVNFRFYVSCQDTVDKAIDTCAFIRCKSSSSRLPLTIRKTSEKFLDITCDSLGNSCSSLGTSNKQYGYRQLDYVARINFKDTALRSVTGCGQLLVETLGLKRSDSINTGVKGAYYNYLLFDPMSFPKNSGPTLNVPPQCVISNYSWVRNTFGTSDKDNDSLSYFLTAPWQDWRDTLSYDSGYSANSFVQVYNRYNPMPSYRNFYLDPETGFINYSPTNAGDWSVMTVVVREWAKDSSGKYELRSEMRRDVSLRVTQPLPNINPDIKGPFSYPACTGDTFSIEIETYDKPYVPPPPASKPPPDSLDVSWYNPIQGSHIQLVSDTARQPAVRFTWIPKEEDIIKTGWRFHNFYVNAKDRFCPLKGSASKVYNVRVQKRVDSFEFDINELKCGVFQLVGTQDSSGYENYYEWTVFNERDSIIFGPPRMIPDPDDSTGNRCITVGSNDRKRQVDTITFVNPGQYTIQLKKCYRWGCCKTIQKSIRTSSPVDMIRLQDSTLCHGDSVHVGLSKEVSSFMDTISWSLGSTSGNGSTFDFLKGKGEEILKIRALDTLGCLQTDTVHFSAKYSPQLDTIADTMFCGKYWAQFIATDLHDSGLVKNSFRWSHGGKDDTTYVDTSGLYFVYAANECGSDTTSFNVTAHYALQLDLGQDRFLCDRDSVVIGKKVDSPEIQYQWRHGPQEGLTSVKNAGTYSLTISNPCFSATDSLSVHFGRYPKPVLPDSLIFCDSVKATLDAGNPGATHYWSSGQDEQVIDVTTAGLYVVWMDAGRCGQLVDSTLVKLIPVPKVDLGKDKFLCDETSLELRNRYARQGYNYQWNGGQTTSTIIVRSSGVYTLEVENRCHLKSDTVLVQFESTPSPVLPEFRSYCDVILDSLYAGLGSDYLWDDGSTKRTKTVDSEGWHWVIVSTEHCGTAEDSMYADLNVTPQVDLGADRLLEKPFSVILDAGEQDVTYRWNTGDTTRSIKVTEFGAYYVQLHNSCGTASDTILIKEALSASSKALPAGWNVYPNPADGTFYLRHETGKSPKLTLRDVNGRSIPIRTSNTETGLIKVEASVSNGVYFLELELENAAYNARVLIER